MPRGPRQSLLRRILALLRVGIAVSVLGFGLGGATARPQPDGQEASTEGPDETGANETGANETGANETGANEIGANETGANETGANETGANEIGANEIGANGLT